MSKNIGLICKTENEAQAKVLYELACKKGWNRTDVGGTYSGCAYIAYKSSSKDRDASYTVWKEFPSNSTWHIEQITVDQFLEGVLNDKWPSFNLPPEPVVYPDLIGGNKVEYVSGEYIKVGCTLIKDQEIQKLIKAYNGTKSV